MGVFLLLGCWLHRRCNLGFAENGGSKRQAFRSRLRLFGGTAPALFAGVGSQNPKGGGLYARERQSLLANWPHRRPYDALVSQKVPIFSRKAPFRIS